MTAWHIADCQNVHAARLKIVTLFLVAFRYKRLQQPYYLRFMPSSQTNIQAVVEPGGLLICSYAVHVLFMSECASIKHIQLYQQ